MSTLSQFLISLLSLLPRAPFWAQALVLCALFAVVGVAVLDDYGVAIDEPFQRRIATTVADYALGISEEPPDGHDRYYGVVFEMPLLLLERAIGLQDTRHIYLTRHLFSHLFFIAGGFVCGALAYRMLGSRWIALFAMLMFLLHPRLYAHSFFNTKDIPFAAMLVIALYLAHRAFRRDTLGAFLLCGIGVGLAINLRVFGLMLLPMILAMRALDLRQASGEERNHILASVGIFAAAALAIPYIIHPYYWETPLRFLDGVRVLSQHPTYVLNLFMGEIYSSYAVPWNYIPVWFAITAPPVALLLGAVGCVLVCWQAVARPLRTLHDRETRFRILLLGCFALPVVVAIALQSNIVHGWRQMYFLWAPFCLLAAVGLRTITNIHMGGGIWKIGARLPGWVRGCALRRALAYGVAGVGLITTATAMVALHPYEHVYFTALTDTNTPGALAKRYDMDYWRMARRQSLEHLLARYPDDTLRVAGRFKSEKSTLILPQIDRERIVITRDRDRDADFYFRQSFPDQPEFHSIHVYGSVIESILAPNSDVHLDHYRAAYNDAAANGTLLARADFDIYAHNGELLYLNSDCAPPTASINFINIFLHVFPVNRADLPSDYRERGFERRDFAGGAFFDGKCIAMRSLPGYPIARIRTGQNMNGEMIWRADIDLAAHAAAQATYEDIIAGDYGLPVAQSGFDVYLRGDVLAYLKENCAAGDGDARFFLHIIPAETADMPAVWRERGFENLDFQFTDHGAYAGDKCVITRELPDYPIEHILTGQFVSGEGRLWSAEFSAAR